MYDQLQEHLNSTGNVNVTPYYPSRTEGCQSDDTPNNRASLFVTNKSSFSTHRSQNQPRESHSRACPVQKPENTSETRRELSRTFITLAILVYTDTRTEQRGVLPRQRMRATGGCPGVKRRPQCIADVRRFNRLNPLANQTCSLSK